MCSGCSRKIRSSAGGPGSGARRRGGIDAGVGNGDARLSGWTIGSGVELGDEPQRRASGCPTPPPPSGAPGVNTLRSRLLAGICRFVEAPTPRWRAQSRAVHAGSCGMHGAERQQPPCLRSGPSSQRSSSPIKFWIATSIASRMPPTPASTGWCRRPWCGRARSPTCRASSGSAAHAGSRSRSGAPEPACRARRSPTACSWTSRADWRRIEPLDRGRRVRVQPGAIGAHVNRALVPYGSRIGPDPASIDACTIGGILSNNSSGMCCGVAQNSYQTLDSLVLVLPSGLVIDTADAEAAVQARRRRAGARRGAGRASRPGARHAGARLARATQVPHEEHERLFAQRVPRLRPPHRHPAPPDGRRRGHARVHCRGRAAYRARPPGAVHRPAALRLDRRGLLRNRTARRGRSGRARSDGSGGAALGAGRARRPAGARDAPGRRRGPPRRVPGTRRSRLEALAARAASSIRDLALLEPARFTGDPAEQALLWRIRKGMFPSVGAVRRRGTTVIIEDVAFPVPALAASGRRTPGALHETRIRGRDHLRAREGRQPPLRADAGVRRSRVGRSIRALHGRRRLAGGRAL